MANFADNDTGREEAEALVTTQMTAGIWVEGHEAQNVAGHVICRFIRPMSPTAPDAGAWVESRDTAQDV